MIFKTFDLENFDGGHVIKRTSLTSFDIGYHLHKMHTELFALATDV